jgi:hypothetical protein
MIIAPWWFSSNDFDSQDGRIYSIHPVDGRVCPIGELGPHHRIATRVRRDVFGAQVPMHSHAPPAAAISTRLGDIFPLDKPSLKSQ